MSTLTINIKSAEEVGLLNDRFASGQPHQALNRIANYLNALNGGARTGVVDVTTSSSNPVAAAGTITITHANLDANDTVTVGGVTFTAKASGATGAQFNIGADATADATALKTAINAHATLSKHVLASSALGVVTVTCKTKGTIGNFIVMATSDATAYALVQLTGGTGGPEGTPVTYTR